MRILFLADAVWDDLPGGSRVVARETASELVLAGHQVTLLCARHNESAPADEMNAYGFRTIRYDGAGKPLDFIRNGRNACARLVAQEPFDIVHTHFAYASVGPLRAVPRSVPRIRSFHGPWDQELWIQKTRHDSSPGHRLSTWAKKQYCRYVETSNLAASQHVVALSDAFAQILVDRYGVSRDKISIVPGGADISRFKLGNAFGERGRLGIPLDRRVILSIRRLAPRMGLDNLIQAMPDVVARNPDVLLLIGGKGPERERLQQMVNELHLERHVRLIGFVSDQDLPAYYQAADLFVLPTVALEGFGLVIVEALACGVPVIGTPVGAIPETLRRLDGRLVADGTNSQALGAAILRFFDEAWSSILTRERLHDFVESNYTWKHHAAAMEEIYLRALAGRERLVERNKTLTE
ncbi:MAG: glycosyltransferase family 4 protein [Capsulimonadaceae bacterium]|nr:glycosyltransferase family 4 protein [Capsulimonadaceae bacterium]